MVEYSVEPNCPISEYADKLAKLRAAARRGYDQIHDLASRREALELRAKYESLLGFRLRVRGTAVE